MTDRISDIGLWRAYCDAEQRMVDSRMILLREVSSLDSVVGDALKSPSQRGIALRLLLSLPPDFSKPHLAQIVRLATVGHSDVVQCRDLLYRLEDALHCEVERLVLPILADGGEEEYRRVAELYDGLDRELLGAHLARCAVHPEDDIREIAADFEARRGQS